MLDSLSAIVGAPSARATASDGVPGTGLRRAMGHFATGAAVICSHDRAGRKFGTTANAVSSVSLDPPLVLACVARESETLAVLIQSERFTINVPGAAQRALAARVARPSSAGSRDGVEHRPGGTPPVLQGDVAVLDCMLQETVGAGDHIIVLGRVVEVEHGEAHVDPLLSHSGGHLELEPEAPAPTQEAGP
jgi:flavin reductase (DIM6/NTAB) family NADH-FMN oxidoreductase RutF